MVCLKGGSSLQSSPKQRKGWYLAADSLVQNLITIITTREKWEDIQTYWCGFDPTKQELRSSAMAVASWTEGSSLSY
ncbi:hypothetical protein SLE2022_097850 [Rubroshorea leprosula]